MVDFHLGGVGLAVLGGVIGKLVSGWGIAIAVFAAIFAISLLVGFVRRWATLYTISDRRLYIRRGLLSRTEQHATLDRVQNVEANQSLFERVLHIGTVDFDTAATDDSVFAFVGVAAPKRVLAAVDRAIDSHAGSGGQPARGGDDVTVVETSETAETTET
jgi:putative membrane protein